MQRRASSPCPSTRSHAADRSSFAIPRSLCAASASRATPTSFMRRRPTGGGDRGPRQASRREARLEPAFERAHRYGLYTGPLEGFAACGGARVELLKRLRTGIIRRARRVVVPSRYLAEIAEGFGLESSRIEVLTNPAPAPARIEAEARNRHLRLRGAADRAEGLARRTGRARGGACSTARARGRRAGARSARGGCTRSLDLDNRVRFVGCLPRKEVLRYLAGARAALLSSSWENLPHAVVEALAVGTPVVATAVGGVPEVVHDGENGLLVPAGDVPALAAALAKVAADGRLRDRLAAGAQPSVERIGREPTYARLKQFLRRGGRVTPRVLFVGRGRLSLPLPPWLAKKWDAVGAEARLPGAERGHGRWR